MASDSTARDLEKVVRDGLSTLVLAFGNKTGIIDEFIKIHPCTAEELSQKTGKKLRYIQEWLGCLVSTGIVKIHEDGKYSLPYEDSMVKECCNIAAALPVLSDMFPRLEKVLPEDGPRGYGYYDPFLEWWGTYHNPEVTWIHDQLIPILDFKSGTQFTLLDLGCGYGRLTREIARLYPDSTIIGIDMDQVSIDHANKALEKSDQKNLQFLCMKGGHLPKDWTAKFDFVILVDLLHDSYEVDGILEETKRVLKPDGHGAAYDPPVSSYHKKLVDNKAAQFFLPLSLFSCLPMSSSGPSGGGLGVGWGYERRKEKVEEHGFKLIPFGGKDVNTIQECIAFQK